MLTINLFKFVCSLSLSLSFTKNTQNAFLSAKKAFMMEIASMELERFKRTFESKGLDLKVFR